MSSPTPRTRAIPLVLGALLATAIGCRLTDASIWNLGQLHNPDGSFRRVGALVSGPEYFVRFGLLSFALRAGDYQEPALQAIEDPAEESLDNLNILSEGERDDPGVRRAQVEWFGFLAVDSPWALARERCIEELTELARELDVEPARGPAPEKLATVDEVREALLALVTANGEVLRGSRELGPQALAEACETLRGFELSRRGALSALRGIGPLEEAADRDDPAFAPLVELSRDLQRRVVRLALEETLRDPSVRVLAAAIRANAAAFGDAVLAPLLSQLTSGQVFPEPVVRATLVAVEEHGLPDLSDSPDGPAFTDEQRLGFRLRCVDFLVETGTRHPSSRVRFAALKALRRVEPPDFGPREEEWQAWWSEERPKRIAELDASSVTPASPPTPEDPARPAERPEDGESRP